MRLTNCAPYKKFQKVHLCKFKFSSASTKKQMFVPISNKQQQDDSCCLNFVVEEHNATKLNQRMADFIYFILFYVPPWTRTVQVCYISAAIVGCHGNLCLPVFVGQVI